MEINSVQFNCELTDILSELQNQLRINHIPLLQKVNETSTHFMVQCPYHNDGQERKPSAGIRKKDGKFHCFACSEIHSLPEVISHCFGEDDYTGKFGWKWLLKNFAVTEIEERKNVDLDFARSGIYSNNSKRNRSNSNTDNFVSEEELDSYRYTHPYMYKRGLTDEIIETFDIGFDSNSKCITFPVRDIQGNCLFIARRSVVTKYFNYPKGVEKPLYGLYEYFNELRNTKQMPMRDQDEIIICEGMFDALTCWVYGRYALALNGLGSPLQFEQLKALPLRKLILATDNDEKGRQAKKRIRKNITNKIITEFEIPNGKKDINELDAIEFDKMQEIW